MEEEWAMKANEAIHISFYRPETEGPKEIASFQPEYTEQFFGQEQSIFGYKKPHINLRFSSHDLFPNIEIKYEEKWRTIGDTKADDLKKVFKELLPESAFQSSKVFDDRLKDEEKAKSFKPPGERVDSYSIKDRHYEIWAGELSDRSVIKIVERVQVLVPFFIDGGILIPVDDPEWSAARWRVLFIFEILPSSSSSLSLYSLVGYCTAYRFLTYQPSTSTHFTSHPTTSSHSTHSTLPTLSAFPPSTPIAISSLPNRTRISQFLILLPHQKQGHGTHLYDAATSSALSDPACIEITVEDPNESFDDLRDLCDYTRLSHNGTFAAIKFNPDLDPKLTARRRGLRVPTSMILSPTVLEKLRIKNKLAPRQFARLVEMYLLSTIPLYARQGSVARQSKKANASDKGDRMFYYWRLLVKQRIYRQHKDVLVQLEGGEERVGKLEQTLETVLVDYERLLEKIAERKKEIEDKTEADRNGERMAKRVGKRKIVDDDEDDENDGEEANGAGEEVGKMAAKKPKVGL